MTVSDRLGGASSGPVRRSRLLPVLDVAWATPAVVRSAAALPGAGIYPSQPVTYLGGIFRSRAAFSPPAGPRRSVGYAGGGPIGLALYTPQIKPI